MTERRTGRERLMLHRHNSETERREGLEFKGDSKGKVKGERGVCLKMKESDMERRDH